MALAERLCALGHWKKICTSDFIPFAMVPPSKSAMVPPLETVPILPLVSDSESESMHDSHDSDQGDVDLDQINLENDHEQQESENESNDDMHWGTGRDAYYDNDADDQLALLLQQQQDFLADASQNDFIEDFDSGEIAPVQEKSAETVDSITLFCSQAIAQPKPEGEGEIADMHVKMHQMIIANCRFYLEISSKHILASDVKEAILRLCAMRDSLPKVRQLRTIESIENEQQENEVSEQESEMQEHDTTLVVGDSESISDDQSQHEMSESEDQGEILQETNIPEPAPRLSKKRARSDPFGENSEITSSDLIEKAHRKKSLKFHVNRIVKPIANSRVPTAPKAVIQPSERITEYESEGDLISEIEGNEQDVNSISGSEQDELVDPDLEYYNQVTEAKRKLKQDRQDFHLDLQKPLM